MEAYERLDELITIPAGSFLMGNGGLNSLSVPRPGRQRLHRLPCGTLAGPTPTPGATADAARVVAEVGRLARTARTG